LVAAPLFRITRSEAKNAALSLDEFYVVRDVVKHALEHFFQRTQAAFIVDRSPAERVGPRSPVPLFG
jgi:hypothetical protein